MHHAEPLAEGIAAGIVTSFRGDPIEWLVDNVRLPHSARSSRFDPLLSPWVAPMFSALINPRNKQVLVRAPVGGSKTTLMELFACWIPCHAVGPTFFGGQTQATVDRWAESRLVPVLEACQPVAALFPASKQLKRKSEIMFPHMPLWVGPANMTNAQELSLRNLVVDEFWRLEPGMHKELEARFHNRSVRTFLIITQGWNGGCKTDAGADLDEQWAKSEQFELGTECAGCGVWSKYRWENLRYDEPRCEDGRLNWEAFVSSIRYICPSCQHETPDTDAGRRGLASRSSFRSEGNNHVPGFVAYTYNSLAIWWINWATLAAAWIDANTQKHLGNFHPLRQFLQKQLAQPVSEVEEAPAVALEAADYLLEDFKDGTAPTGERARFATVDVQRSEYWMVIASWSTDGCFRLLWAGKVLGAEGVQDLQARFNVKSQFLFIDAQYETARVYDYCAKWGWTALHGSGRDYFVTKTNRGRIRRLYSALETAAAPSVKLPNGAQARIRYLHWASDPVKDILAQLRNTGAPRFEFGKDTPPEFVAHLNSEVKRKTVDKNSKLVRERWKRIGNRPNHLWDCCAMQVLAALMTHTLGTIEQPAQNDDE